ncbi:endonuclease MutS2 [bacterium]|nr:endonuclease MutS2 [bacterium]
MDARTREVLELDAILNELAGQALSPLGSEYIRALEPATDLEEIEGRLAIVREFIALLEVNRRVPLAGLVDVTELLARADVEGSALDAEDWPQLRKFLTVIANLVHFADENDEDYPHLADYCRRLHPNADLRHAIDRVFDENGLVRDNASPELAKARGQLRRAEHALERTMNRILGNLRGGTVLQDDFSTIRNGRHVLPVRAGSRGKIQGIVHGTSASGETLYVEPTEVVESANEVELCREREKLEIHRILLELTRLLRPFIEEANEDLTTLGVLDGMGALARNAFQRGWKIPVLSKGAALKLFDAHHPMLHLTRAASSVPIAISLVPGDHTVILSGPNAGGKTTAMKTLALSAILLQCGSPIPASPDSRLPVFRGFHADIGDQQDLEEGISTFSGHVRRIQNILRIADDRSLVLLDELGTGTDPAEGGALAQAILEDFGKRAALTITTSHLGGVKKWAGETEGVRNASFSLDPNTHRPTYRLRLDLPGASEALYIAENEGLPKRVLERARSLVGDQHLAMGELLRNIEERERTLGEALRDANARAKALEEQERTARRHADQLRDERKKLRREALEQRESAAREVRERVERMIADLPGEEELRQRKDRLAEARRELVREQHRIGQERDLLEKTDERPASDVESGKRVYIAPFGAWGEILETSRDGKRAEVQMGAMQLSVATSDLLDHEPESPSPLVEEKDEKAEDPKSKGKRKKSRKVKAALEVIEKLPADRGRSTRHRAMSGPSGTVVQKGGSGGISLELDLHGFRVEEALAAVDKYLDRALMADVPYVRINHGTGTGKLYRAVHDYLRSYPSVKKFRFATPDEGGGGVTIVEF